MTPSLIERLGIITMVIGAVMVSASLLTPRLDMLLGLMIGLGGSIVWNVGLWRSPR
jgi:hypothetical protein